MNNNTEGGLRELAASLSGWRNRNDTCGAYAAAVMLAGLQDAEYPDLIPEEIRKPGDTDGTKLVAAVTECMHGAKKTLPFHVSMGVNRFIREYAPEYVQLSMKAHFRLLPGKKFLKEEFAKGHFCCLGIVRYRGSKYGNHWVAAYDVKETDRRTVYLAHDNWGQPEAEIPAGWVNSAVYIKYM